MTTGLQLTHEQRMILEKEQLDEKIEQLQEFLEHKAPIVGVEPCDLDLLRHQLGAMFLYSELLEVRIYRSVHSQAEG